MAVDLLQTTDPSVKMASTDQIGKNFDKSWWQAKCEKKAQML